MEVNLKKKNTGLIIGIAAVVVVLAIILIMVFSSGSKDPLQEQLDLGDKYMQEMDYEQAVAAYLAAIEIDDKCVEAYIGAAEAYMAMDDIDSAIDILTNGYEATQDELIESMLDQILEDVSDEDILEEDDVDDETISTDELEIPLVQLDDPELAESANEYYELIVGDPSDPYGYYSLAEVYIEAGEMEAAKTVVEEGLKRTESQRLEDILDYLEYGSYFICGGYDEIGQYRVTYNETYIEPQEKENGNYAFIKFNHYNDPPIVQINVINDYASFEDYYNSYKEWHETDPTYSNVEYGEPYQLQCGNVIVNCYKYSVFSTDEKLDQPSELKYQVFYVDLGNGIGIYGVTDDFWDGYTYFSGEEKCTVTFDEFVSYLFVSVEEIHE